MSRGKYIALNADADKKSKINLKSANFTQSLLENWEGQNTWQIIILMPKFKINVHNLSLVTYLEISSKK